MNPYLQEYITQTREYHAKDGNPSSVAALYDLADELAKSDDLEAKKVLADLYDQLGLYTSAYSLLTEILDKPDRKQLKKLSRLQEMSQSHGDRFALSRPLRKEEKKQRQKLLQSLPHFIYHPDPLATGSFVEGEAKVCPSCGKESNVYYALRPYSIEEVEHLCPTCIANGQQLKNSMQNLSKMPSGRVNWIQKRISCFFVRPQTTLVGRENIGFLVAKIIVLTWVQLELVN